MYTFGPSSIKGEEQANLHRQSCGDRVGGGTRAAPSICSRIRPEIVIHQFPTGDLSAHSEGAMLCVLETACHRRSEVTLAVLTVLCDL